MGKWPNTWPSPSKRPLQTRLVTCLLNTCLIGINDEFYRKGGLVSGALQITSRQFSAEEFLLKVHSNTSFEKLNASIPMLEGKIQEKREAQRNLVKQNFERFVSAKATIDAVFLEMQSQGLTTGEFGLERCRDAVVVASNKVKELYAPLLESQQREAELRRKIAWVAKHRWLLESPQQLLEYRQVGDYGGFVKYAGDLVRQWKTYAERDSPMLENMQLFWEGSLMPQLKETHECLRDRLCKSSFSSAADAQIVIQQYDVLTLILRQCTLDNMSYEDASGLSVYLKAQDERLIVEINKIFIAA